MQYFLHILILILIYGIVSLSLDLVAGYSGLISIAHAAFFGAGAYIVALSSFLLKPTSFLPLLLALIIAFLLGLMTSLLSWKLTDDFFVIATLSVQLIIYQVFLNWTKLTNGPLGLPGINRPVFFGFSLSSNISYLLFVTIIVIIILVITKKLVSSPFGYVLRGLRENELYAKSLGKNINYHKSVIFSLSATS